MIVVIIIVVVVVAWVTVVQTAVESGVVIAGVSLIDGVEVDDGRIGDEAIKRSSEIWKGRGQVWKHEKETKDGGKYLVIHHFGCL